MATVLYDDANHQCLSFGDLAGCRAPMRRWSDPRLWSRFVPHLIPNYLGAQVGSRCT